ncbi:MAG: hypothetical protein A2418_01585 [Candidatus Brennerbacteria bacterium RIFOXYC1_FULL_41_11]|uniref:Uncharacterized protein n=1 Tax=Candidatus Brennerbacteria bacterium RIFOXYD1_FULL_41_16 TaxID=1797529 RepID=A0A1G1XK63_9BACT|nr:MAG: hypothetical protein A2418_01585 [Candidatus Brennerbacteria bacterium RIFOXYC1_FULL_41_11]OGY39373.1 MAG: hypothetical protein A2391_02775 [Candidatus Brennerbacteria bacterium RIFOXYB1_FULL_41_13]OGY40000.1 MAG: hypothetical protein A2570_00725 [Candidatus Brennerbacteria bacterium RIFOXYD1_FULL_41_16]
MNKTLRFVFRGLRFWGQSTLEMLVVFSVTTLFLSMVLGFNRTAKNQNEFFQFIDRFILDIRKVQDLSYLSQEYNGPEQDYRGTVPCAYGMLFDALRKDRYTIFAAFSNDCSGIQGGNYEAIEIETVLLPSLINFGQTSSNPVIFVPPYPRTLFFPQADSAIVRLVLRGSANSFRDVSINKAGQIGRVISE